MAEDLVVVGTFNTRPEAELAKSALEAAGIESTVFGDDAGGTQPGLWEGRGVAVVVNRENERDARAVLTQRAETTGTETTGTEATGTEATGTEATETTGTETTGTEATETTE